MTAFFRISKKEGSNGGMSIISTAISCHDQGREYKEEQ